MYLLDVDVEGILALMIPIISIVGTMAVVITFFSMRYKERRLMIEKGLVPSEEKPRHKQNKDRTQLVLAMLGVGIGLGIGAVLVGLLHVNEKVGYWIPILIFVPLSVIFGKKILRIEKENKE